MISFQEIEAVVFDMDGVIIDSLEIWGKAEREVFASVGVEVTDELTKVTEMMTTTEVTQFWYDKQPWSEPSLEEVENKVIQYVAKLINEEGKAISGVEDTVHKVNAKGSKIGLATNSPACLIPVVLEKLNIADYFNATTSAEFEVTGKPDPSIYLTIARKLSVMPEKCLVIEDSRSGVLAAKRAGMKAIYYSSAGGQCDIADVCIKDYQELEVALM